MGDGTGVPSVKVAGVGRKYAKMDDLYAEKERSSVIDVEALKRMGLNARAVLRIRSSFSSSNVLPLLSCAAVEGTGRVAFFESVCKWSNLYALATLGLGSGRGHAFASPSSAAPRQKTSPHGTLHSPDHETNAYFLECAKRGRFCETPSELW